MAIGDNIILPLMDLRFGLLISLITRNLIALRTTYVVILAGRALLISYGLYMNDGTCGCLVCCCVIAWFGLLEAVRYRSNVEFGNDKDVGRTTISAHLGRLGC